MNDSTTKFKIAWSDVQNIFNYKKYVQPQLPFDEEHLQQLRTTLATTHDKFVFISMGSYIKLLYFIFPILLYACNTFKQDEDEDVTILPEENLKGREVEFTSHFEYILKRGNKAAVCIVEGWCKIL